VDETMRSVLWKSVVVAAALLLGAANMTTHAASGMSGAAHFVGGGFPISRGFVRTFPRNFAFRNRFATPGNIATGGWWPYDYYDYGSADVTYTPTYLPGFVTGPMPAPVCHRSEEIVRVPAAGGGTRQIKIIRCP
jgi:hypothetical protein